MNIVPASLQDVLAAREGRVHTQSQLLRQYGKPLVSLTMNIAGPYKNTPLVVFAFHSAVRQILTRLGPPLDCRRACSPAGVEAIFVYDMQPEALKARAVQLEEASEAGRLLDIDVLRPDGTKLSRLRPRTCLICQAPAALCARSRAHSLEVLEQKTNQILKTHGAREISRLAVDALLQEVHLTPKPGLVDEGDNGAHRDMDLSLMEKSAACLAPYFFRCAQMGMDTPVAIPGLQRAGIRAEEEMFRITRGVNTHKGAIYTLGLLCAGAGSSLTEGGDALSPAARMAGRLEGGGEDTHGAAAARRYGAAGIRGEAQSGFPHVRAALDCLRGGGTPLQALLLLMEQLDDTNLLYRGGLEGLRFVQREAARIRQSAPGELLPLLEAFNRQCIEKNLSPGGSADLLSAALFLRALDPPQL